MAYDADVLAEIDAAFGAVPKPEHFTDFEHCEECSEHDETLRSHDRESLEVSHVGNAGWDPLCFCSPIGLAYYLPTLARFALAEPTYNYGWYGDQFLFHVIYAGEENRLLRFCSPEQRRAIAALLVHIVETRATESYVISSQDELLRAHELWQQPNAA